MPLSVLIVVIDKKTKKSFTILDFFPYVLIFINRVGNKNTY